MDKLSHLLGCKHTEFSFLPKFEVEKTASWSDVKEARKKDWTEAEKRALIDEEGEARNISKLDLSNTHYEIEDDLGLQWSIGL